MNINPRILHIADGAEGGSAESTPPNFKSREKQLLARIAELESENAKLRSVQEQNQKDEALIAEKTALGLTREQALAVIKRQREHGDVRQKAYDEARAIRVAASQK